MIQYKPWKYMCKDDPPWSLVFEEVHVGGKGNILQHHEQVGDGDPGKNQVDRIAPHVPGSGGWVSRSKDQMLKEPLGEDQDVDQDVDQDFDVDVDIDQDVDQEPVGKDQDVDQVEDDAHGADGHRQVTVDWLI